MENGPAPAEPSGPTSCSAARSNATANVSAKLPCIRVTNWAGLRRATSAETTKIDASFFGSIVFGVMLPAEAGFCSPSPTHAAVGRVEMTGIFTPDGPRGTCGESCCTTEVRAARSKMGAASAGVMNPERSLVLVGAEIAMVSSCGRI